MLQGIRLILFGVLLLAGTPAGIAQTAAFSVSPKSGCAPLAVSFSDQSTGTVTSWQWDLGNGVTPATATASTVYGTPGRYVVRLNATGPSGSDTATDTIIVYGGPSVSFTASSLAGCSPHSTQFSTTVTPNAPGPLRYFWTFGDGYTDTAANPVHTYQTAGTFTTYVTVYNGPGCDSIAVRHSYVTAWERPQLSFTADQTSHCSFPATINFSASASGGISPYTYQWDFGDNTSGTGSTPSHVYAGGTFPVSGVVTDSRGCRDTVTRPNYIFVLGTVAGFTAGDVCEDSALIFTNTTGTSHNPYWDFGDGTTDTGQRVPHVYTNPGVYTAQMKLNINGCHKTDSLKITVHPRPVIGVRMDPWLPCPAPTTATLIATSNLPVTYKWHWISGAVDSGDTVRKFYSVNRVDTVRVYGKTVHGCVSSVLMDTIFIRDILPGAVMHDYRFDILPPELVVGGCFPYDAKHSTGMATRVPWYMNPNPYPYPATITSYRWLFPNGSTSTQAYPRYLYTDTGWVQSKVVFTTSNGCTDSAIATQYVIKSFVPNFGVIKDSVCRRDLVGIYFKPPFNPDKTLYLYHWTSIMRPLLFTTYRDTFYFPNRIDSTFGIRLLTQRGYCLDTGAGEVVVATRMPIARFKVVPTCWPDSRIQFINNSLGAHRSLWAFGDGNFDTARNAFHTYLSNGAYKPTLITYDSIGLCTDTLFGSANINVAPPIFNPSIWPSQACIGTPVQLHVQYPAFPIADLHMYYVRLATEGDTTLWMPGTDTLYHSYRSAGKHDVTLFIRYGELSCLDTIVLPGAVGISKPLPQFGADIVRDCLPVTVHFSDSSGNALPGRPNADFVWSYGIAREADTILGRDFPIQVYETKGAYTVKLVVTDSAGCRDSLEKPHFIHAHETIARFDSLVKGYGPDSICLNSSIPFGSASTGYTSLSQLWTFGDGGSDTSLAPRHQYTSRGFFPLTLVATDSIGCADTVRRHVPIRVLKPEAAFSLNPRFSICPMQQVDFTDKSVDAYTYRWDLGDGSPGPVVKASPSTTYPKPAVYHVTLVVADKANCRDTATDSVVILGYKGAFSFDPPSGCMPLEVTFRPAVSNIPVLTWDFGDGFTVNTSDTAPAKHVYTSGGAFLPKVIFSDGGSCSALSPGWDSVYIDEVRADFNWTVPCADTPFSLTSLSTARYGAPNQFQWSAPGAAAAGSPGQLKITAAGTHPVTLIATNAAGCADTITKDVVINPLPPVSAGTDTAVCPGDTAHIFASGALTYTWATASSGSGPACTNCAETTVWPKQDAVYVLSGRDANGCYGRDSVAVRIQIKTTSTTGPGGAICYGQSFRLEAGGADTYQWTPAETIDSPAIAAPLATPRTTTTYTVISQEGSCQVDTQRITVGVNARPAFSAGPDKIISLGAAATLESRGTFKTIRWLNNDSTLSCLDCPRPNASPHYTRTYWATVTDENGCETTDSVTVHVRCNGSYVFIPNTFTPNGDGQNDWFYPQGSGLEGMRAMRIFNRWGQLVFESMNVPLNSPSAGWDGRFKGEALAPDTYFYVMSSRCATGEIVEFKGDVTLVR